MTTSTGDVAVFTAALEQAHVSRQRIEALHHDLHTTLHRLLLLPVDSSTTDPGTTIEIPVSVLDELLADRTQLLQRSASLQAAARADKDKVSSLSLGSGSSPNLSASSASASTISSISLDSSASPTSAKDKDNQRLNLKRAGAPVLKFARKQLDHAVRITKHHDSSASASASSDRADSPSLPVDQTQQFHELLASLKSAVNWASVFTYTGMRSLMIVPSSSVNNPALLFSGPGDSSATDETFFDYASGRAISTYPLRATGGLRDGDPICDRYIVAFYRRRILLALADGCGWGDKPRHAARLATDAFCEYIGEKQTEPTTVQQLAELLLQGVAMSHLAITAVGGQWESGTTTMLGGLLVQIATDSPQVAPWCFVAVSVGDCKCLHISRRDRRVSEITCGNRINISQPSDPGGRIGPYRSDSGPDLRNLAVYWQPCETGDVIIVMSDGVHDNLDPEMQGIPPYELGLTVRDWAGADFQEVSQAKTDFMCKFIETSILPASMPQPGCCDAHDLCRAHEPPIDVSNMLCVRSLTNNLIRHCEQMTDRQRRYMEDNPHHRGPVSYKEYPGKLDHTSCICVQVSVVSTDSPSVMHGLPILSPRSTRQAAAV